MFMRPAQQEERRERWNLVLCRFGEQPFPTAKPGLVQVVPLEKGPAVQVVRAAKWAGNSMSENGEPGCGHSVILGAMTVTSRVLRPTGAASDARYDALRSRDRRFDGTFFVGVRTTGIYCRPVCRARLPHARNCTFHDSAAAAERAGYRPCLRCRPELAPGRSLTDAHARLAGAAYERIVAGALNGRSVADMARELCVGERQLRRAVVAEFGASPVELAQTQRLLLAKQLLTETNLPVARVAYASGFASLTRFNALFHARYRMSPTRLRRERRRPAGSGVTLRLGYRPPLDWERMLAFLAKRAIPGVEYVDATSYLRTLRVDDHAGWLRVRHAPAESALVVEISDTLVPVLMPVRAGVRRLFDLDAEPAVIAAQLGSDARLGPLVRARPGMRLPGCADSFEVAVRAVLGQQVTVAAATTLAGRLTRAYGDSADGLPDGVTHFGLSPERLAELPPAALAGLGMPLARAQTLVALARAIVSGDVAISSARTADETIAALQRIRGIGPWTAQYIAMRGLHWPDAFPASDLGIRTALGGIDAAATAQLAEAWRPWRSYAVIHLWESLAQPRSD
jgi:AraC family transcriptional regulator of adaptative response / DNA-3-methyladenine glycosylase II